MRVSEAFGELILQLKGADTFGKASLKTEISKAYLVEMVRITSEFGRAVKRELEDRGWSYLRACVGTGIPGATIGRMAQGIVPGADHVIAWAKGLRQDINKWLTLAGYDPIPEELVCDVTKADRVRERVAAYLVEKKGMQPEEVKEMFEEINEKGDPL